MQAVLLGVRHGVDTEGEVEAAVVSAADDLWIDPSFGRDGLIVEDTRVVVRRSDVVVA